MNMTTNKIIIDKQTGTILNYDTCVVVDLDDLDDVADTLWNKWNEVGNDGDATALADYAGKALG